MRTCTRTSMSGGFPPTCATSRISAIAWAAGCLTSIRIKNNSATKKLIGWHTRNIARRMSSQIWPNVSRSATR